MAKETMHQKMEHLEKENMLLKEQLKQTQGYLDEERKLSSKLADMYDDYFKKSSYCQQLLTQMEVLKSNNALLKMQNETLKKSHDSQVDKILHLEEELKKQAIKEMKENMDA